MEDIRNISLSDQVLAASGDGAMAPLGQSLTIAMGTSSQRRGNRQAAEVEWQAAIAALTQMLSLLPRPTNAPISTPVGTVVSGPLPVITDPVLTQRLSLWLITPQPLVDALNGRRALLPAANTGHTAPAPAIPALPIASTDPLLSERFCLVVTPTFRLALVLGQPTGRPWAFQYSFDPVVFQLVWSQIHTAVAALNNTDLPKLEQHLSTYPEVSPDYRLVAQFSQGLVAHLPHRNRAPAQQESGLQLAHWHPISGGSGTFGRSRDTLAWTTEASSSRSSPSPLSPDVELLQAMAHEIRTPLTTIRTLTRSLLRRQDVGADVAKRLRRIDEECTQQIDRFSLIFRAAELTTTPHDGLRPTPGHRAQSPLAPIALAQVFQAAVPQWQQQAHRRNLSLIVSLPPHLPRVTSDPTLLHQVLTGVVEWFTQGLPAQSQIQMRVTLAGPQLKLQFESQPTEGSPPLDGNSQSQRPPLRSLGQLLSVAPDTGGVSLNLDVTKTLFQALGGKLIVRQRPPQGEVLTVFLPLETREI